MNTDLKKKQNMFLKKIFFKLMNNSVFGKTVENDRKHRDIKLATTERRRSYLVSELFHRKFISNRNEKNRDTHE